MNERVYLRTFSVAPIHTDDDLESFQRIPELVASMKNEVIYAPGGGILVTGYRGVGKTSFVNKVLFDAKKDLNGRNYELIEVRLNLARGYSTDKLLRRLIRELYFAINQHGIFEALPDEIRRKLEIAFLRTSQQIKTALSHGLRDIITRNESESETHNRGYSLSPSVGIDKISASLASLSRQDSRSKSSSKTTTEEMSQERGIELEFLEYDDEIAESDLSELINLLTHSSTTTKKEDWEPRFDGKLKTPQWLWKRLPNQILGRAINRYLEAPREPLLKGREQKRIKLIFVLDEIDKMSVDQAEEIFRSLKNLFLKGNVTFILLTGIEFYFDRLWKLVSEDDILYTLFTRFVHIPLFYEKELDTLVVPELADKGPTWFQDLLMHLKYRAKGTPREFYRELFRRVEWDKGRPYIEWTDTNETDKRIVYFSTTLLPHVYKQLDAFKAKQLDQGIYDFIYRNMFNWLEWMTFWGAFSKSTLLRPVSEEETLQNKERRGGKPTSKLLTNRHVLAALDELLQTLIENKLIENTGTLNNEPVYEFVGKLKEYQAEIDSSVAFGLQNEEAERHKQITQIRQRVENSMQDANFDEAERLVQEARTVFPEDEELLKLQQTVAERAELHRLEKLGDEQFESGNFEAAYRTFEQIRESASGMNPEIQEKYTLAFIRWAEQTVQQINSDEDGNYAYSLLGRALKASQMSISPQIIEIRKLLQARHDELSHKLELYELTKKHILANDLKSAKDYFEQLVEIDPKSVQVIRLAKQIKSIEDTNGRVDEIRHLMRTYQFDLAEQRINELRQLKTHDAITQEIMILGEQLARIKRYAAEIEQKLEYDSPLVAQALLNEMNATFPLSPDNPLTTKVTEKAMLERKIVNLIEGIAESKYQDSSTAWDYFEELEPLLGSDPRVKKISRDLEMATLGKAKEVTNDIFKTITPGETAFTNYELEAHDPELAVATVSRILAPLLKRDPNHVEANSILRILKERLGG